MSSKIIEIRRKPNKTNLPDHLYEDSTKSIGASLGPSGEVATGLSVAEIEKYMPTLLGISASSPSFYKAVSDYFASMTVKVDTTGVSLQIGMDDKGNPINLQDYITYRFITINPKVASSKADVRVAHQFFLYDPQEETDRKYAQLQMKKNAEKEFIKLTADKKKLELVLTILDPYALRLNPQEQELRINSIKESEPERFLVICTDAHLETKAFIEKCLTAEALRRVGNIFLNGDQKLGDTMEETVLFLEDPKNSELVATLKARVKTFK